MRPWDGHSGEEKLAELPWWPKDVIMQVIETKLLTYIYDVE